MRNWLGTGGPLAGKKSHFHCKAGVFDVMTRSSEGTTNSPTMKNRQAVIAYFCIRRKVLTIDQRGIAKPRIEIWSVDRLSSIFQRHPQDHLPDRFPLQGPHDNGPDDFEKSRPSIFCDCQQTCQTNSTQLIMNLQGHKDITVLRMMNVGFSSLLVQGGISRVDTGRVS